MLRMLYLEDDVHRMFDEVLWIKVRIHVCSQFVWWMRNSWLWLLWFWLFINFHGCSPALFSSLLPSDPHTSCANLHNTLQALLINPSLFNLCIFAFGKYFCHLFHNNTKMHYTQWASATLSPTVHSANGMLFNQAAVCSAVEPEQRQQRHILMCAGSVSCIRGYDSQPARLCPHCNAHSHPLQYQIRLLT